MTYKWLAALFSVVLVSLPVINGIPHLANSSRSNSDKSEPLSRSSDGIMQNIRPFIASDNVPRDLSPLGSNRTGRFFGLTTASSGTGLQLGLSFIVPFLNIPSFGTFGSTSSTLGTTGTTSLLNFNTGSIIFVVLIALAAIIIIPYLIYLTTGANTSPFGRSDDIPGMLNNLAARVDDALQEYNIDAPSCVQRLLCTYVKTASKRMADGNAGSMEKIIDGISTNTYVNSILDGTKIQEAVESGRKPGTPCNSYFIKCPYNMNTIYRSLYDYVSDYNSMQNH